MAKNKVVLAYSGGLDTSVAIRWIAERYDAEIITLTADLGGDKALEDARERAIKIGVARAVVEDLREVFVRDFVFPALQAGAIYEGIYPLATALARPLIAQRLVEVAREEGAFAVAHGCTGKGNDQVRFDVSVAALDPSLKIIAPAREWNMTREEEIKYAQERGIPLASGPSSPYSIDENLWGRSIEAGNLEDPSIEPPEEAFAWTQAIADTPNDPTYLDIRFEKGVPVSINGTELAGIDLIQQIQQIAGENGIGRIDHIENRLVGIKSREVYEAPAATILHTAHNALEYFTLAKDQLRFKDSMRQEYADMVYNGLWHTAHRQDLNTYIQSTQRYVNGTIRVRLLKGSCTVVGRWSPHALYKHELATYDKGDQFDQHAAEGFIGIYGLPVRTQARVQH